jgi:acetylornithine deacetylase/succinyl-diaminopimelate desuccinylase-like protein
LLKLVALLVLAGGGYFAYTHFMPASTPPAPANKPAPAAQSAPVKKAPAVTTPNPAPTPSDTLNQLAHAPKQAINKAQEAIDARRASGQSRVDSALVGEDVPDKPLAEAQTAASKQAPRPPASRPVPATTSNIAPGVAATAQVVGEALGGDPVRLPILGGSLPLAHFEDALHAPLVVLPTVNADNNQHAANENLKLQALWEAVEIFGQLMGRLDDAWR